jgi:hypothetical protein
MQQLASIPRAVYYTSVRVLYLTLVLRCANNYPNRTVHRKAPHNAASELWKDRPRDEDFDLVDVTSDQLPALRASSDIAWGFWNRGSAQDIKNIQKIMSLTVINDDTLAIIKKALKKWEPPEGQKKPTEVPPWPGITFVLDGDNEGLAILGIYPLA